MLHWCLGGGGGSASKPPLDPSIDSAFDFVPRRGGTEFAVTPVEEVLSDDREFQGRYWLPRDANIELSVGRDLLILDLADVASIRVHLQLRGQVQ